MYDVIFIDDESDIRIAIEQSFALENISAAFFATAEEALLAIQNSGLPKVIITDVCLPGLSGENVLTSILKKDANVPIILITAHGDISMAVKALQNGAYDFIEKPFSTDRLIDTTKRAIEKRQLTLENLALKRDLKTSQTLGPRIIGNTAPIQQLREQIAQVGDTDADILIFGETGTGKELVARSIHEQSARRDNQFVAINCGAVPEHLIESELYGHEKGAFTGADSLRIGKFEHADGGTLFLDEIESMPLHAQIRLLRVLQERVIERVGSNRLLPINIRIIAATKVDLRKAADKRQFREDLYYRLNVVTLSLPALRNRKEDITTLFHHFTLVAADRYKRSAPVLSQSLIKQLMSHDWPGNVRELRNAAERLVLLGQLSNISEPNAEMDGESLSLANQVAEFEKSIISQALDHCGGSINKTMAHLQLARKTLYDKMQKYQLDKSHYKND